MTTTTIALLVAFVLLPVLVLLHLTKSKPQRLREVDWFFWTGPIVNL